MGKGSKSKAGRAKAKQGVKRLPCGRINQRHQAFEDDPRQTALQARRRHLGIVATGPVTREEAAKLALFDRGNPLGDWLADGYLTRGHVEVAGDYAARHRRYTTLCGLPKPTPGIGAYGAVRGLSGDPDPDDAVKARRAHMEDQAALRRCSPGVRDQMHRACILMEPATLRWVREGIEALADLHGVELDKPKRKAA